MNSADMQFYTSPESMEPLLPWIAFPAKVLPSYFPQLFVDLPVE